MPRPIPPYVTPGTAEMLRRKRWGLKDLAAHIDRKYTTVVHLFKCNEHQSFFVFKRWCDSLEISIERGIEILLMSEDDRTYEIDKLIRRHYRTYEDYMESHQISSRYLYDIIHGTSGGAEKVLTLYKPIGDALGVPISEMPATIFDIK